MKDSWKEITINQVGDIITGNTPSTKNTSLWDGDIPFYTPGDIKEGNYCNYTERTISRKALSLGRSISIDSIMVTCIGSTIGKIALNPKSGLTNQQINSVVPNSMYDNLFMYYCISNQSSKIKDIAPQTAVPIINKTDFGNQLIIVPPLPQQKKIAHILSTCDEVIEKTEAAIAKYEALKKGLMHDLFTRGIDVSTGQLRPSYQDAPELYKESELSMIPREWEGKKLHEEITVSSGEGLSQLKMMPGTFRVYGGNGVNGSHNNYLFEEQKLIIGRVGEHCGNVHITDPFSWITDNALIVKPVNTAFDKVFWWYYLQSKNLNQFAFSAAQPVITGGILYDIPIVKIPFKEEVLIKNILVAKDEKLHTEQSTLSKYQQLKSGLMQDLLTGAVEVGVGYEEMVN